MTQTIPSFVLHPIANLGLKRFLPWGRKKKSLFGIWDLEIGIYLGFVIWCLEFTFIDKQVI